MRIVVITLFPQMISGFFAENILYKAQVSGILQLEIVNLRNFANDKRGTVDDSPYGGGRGMLLMADPVVKAIQSCHLYDHSHTILTSARGKKFSQDMALQYSKLQELIIVCGHYEGFDERINEYVDDEICLGDFVMTGGEIVASAVADATARLLDGALPDQATVNESFMTMDIDELIKIIGNDNLLSNLKTKGQAQIKLLEYPQYTRPSDFAGQKVPDVLLSSNHHEIRVWRIKQAFQLTKIKRPDLLETS